MSEWGIPPNLDEGPITPLRQAQQAAIDLVAVQWGVAIEIERAVKKSARFC